MKNKLFSVFVVVSVFLLCSVALAGEYKFGYVDIQKVVTESLAGKEAMAQLEKEGKILSEELKTDKDDIEKLGEIIDKQSMMLTDDVRREKKKDYLRKQRDFERKVEDSKTEMQIKEAELTNRILMQLIPIVQDYGKNNNYSIITVSIEIGLLPPPRLITS